MAACVAVIGCGHKDAAPFADAPFSVSRKANAISLPFQVGPFADLSYSYMLAFKFNRPPKNDPTELFWGTPSKAKLRLRVRLIRIEGGHEQPIAIDDHGEDLFDAESRTHCHVESMANWRSDVAKVRMVGHTGGEALMEVVHFRLPGKGFYRMDVETLDDKPIFDDVASWLTIEREYRHLK